MGSALKRLRRDDGQALILVGFCIVPLLAFVGLAVDVGVLSLEQRKLQAVADGAAIAGAAEINYGDWSTAAQTEATLNGVTNGVNGATVSVNPSGAATPTPSYGAYAGKSGYLEVIVTQTNSTIFMQMLNIHTLSLSARAVATAGRNPNCIILLGPTGTTLSIIGAAKLNSPACGVADDSSSASAVSVTTAGVLTDYDTEIVGGASVSNATMTPAAQTGIVPVSDPLSFLSPPTYTGGSSCTADPVSHYQGGSSYNVGPGSNYSTTQSTANGSLTCYTALSVGGNGNTVTLNPGMYVVTGSLSFGNGTIQGGNGVFFYLPAGASLLFNNGSTFNISAMTSGTYNGVLFYQDRSNSTAVSIQGGSTSTMNGILYFPDAQLQFSNGTSYTFATPIIAQSVTMTGGGVFTDNDYSVTNSSSVLAAPRLVE